MEATSRRRRYFTREKKEMILREHYSTGISVPVLARKYGIHAITLYAWKRYMKDKKDQTEMDPEFIQNLIEENDRLKGQNKDLLAKVGDLSIKNDILKDGIEIAQKKAFLKSLQSPKKSKHKKSTK